MGPTTSIWGGETKGFEFHPSTHGHMSERLALPTTTLVLANTLLTEYFDFLRKQYEASHSAELIRSSKVRKKDHPVGQLFQIRRNPISALHDAV